MTVKRVSDSCDRLTRLRVMHGDKEFEPEEIEKELGGFASWSGDTRQTTLTTKRCRPTPKLGSTKFTSRTTLVPRSILHFGTDTT